MSSIEEKLWNYIDGGGTNAEREEMRLLIAGNEEYRLHYEMLLQLDAEFKNMEMDEPAMAFTYNVMEQIRTQEARVPLKAGINKRIIWCIGAFFIISIIALLTIALGSLNWTANSNSPVNLPVSAPQVGHVFSGSLLKLFLFFDIILGLFVADSWLRRRASKQIA